MPNNNNKAGPFPLAPFQSPTVANTTIRAGDLYELVSSIGHSHVDKWKINKCCCFLNNILVQVWSIDNSDSSRFDG
jgi:hypothetical protein